MTKTNIHKAEQPRRFHHVPGTDPYTHQRTRAVEPVTKRELSPLKKRFGVAAIASVALTGAALMSGGEDAPKTPDKAPTTVVIAKEGDSIWKLQEKEGFNGNKPYEVVQKAVELNGTSKIFPGQEVVLVNDPNTNPTNSQP